MPEGGFLHPQDGRSWELYHVATAHIAKAGYAEDIDLEDTLMVQLLTHELGIVTLGAMLVARLFPELYPLCLVLNKKLIELSDVQHFFSEGSEDSPSNEGL